MKHIKTLIILATCLFSLLAFSGCDIDVFEESPDTYVFTDQYGHQQRYTADELQTLKTQFGSQQKVQDYIEYRFETDYPADYAGADTPARIAASDVEPGEVKPSADAEAVVDTVGMLPIPYAPLVSTALSGILGIAAVWQRRKRKTAEKVSISLVKGIDCFRDIVDQTVGGERIDHALTDSLKAERDKMQVKQEVERLLEAHATPDKPKGGITAAAPIATA